MTKTHNVSSRNSELTLVLAEDPLASGPWRLLTMHGILLEYLIRYPSHSTRDFAKMFGITNKAVLRLCSELEGAGYVEGRRTGRKISWHPSKHPQMQEAAA